MPDNPAATFCLVVLQSSKPEEAKEFYSTLGLAFVEEKHGTGPMHYSTTLGPVVLEIYPWRGGNSPTPVRIGFRVHSLDETVEKYRAQGVRIVREPSDSPWGRRAVVNDPDGNRVELTAID